MEPEIHYEKRVGGKVVTRFLVSSERGDEIDNFLRARSYVRDEHGNSKPVVVCAIDEEIYGERIRSKGAKLIVDFYFPSARAASSHFGYAWDAVGQALGRAKMRNQTMAKVAGVSLQWAAEIEGVD